MRRLADRVALELELGAQHAPTTRDQISLGSDPRRVTCLARSRLTGPAAASERGSPRRRRRGFATEAKMLSVDLGVLADLHAEALLERHGELEGVDRVEAEALDEERRAASRSRSGSMSSSASASTITVLSSVSSASRSCNALPLAVRGLASAPPSVAATTPRAPVRRALSIPAASSPATASKRPELRGKTRDEATTGRAAEKAARALPAPRPDRDPRPRRVRPTGAAGDRLSSQVREATRFLIIGAARGGGRAALRRRGRAPGPARPEPGLPGAHFGRGGRPRGGPARAARRDLRGDDRASAPPSETRSRPSSARRCPTT